MPTYREVYLPKAPGHCNYAIAFDFGSHLVQLKGCYFMTSVGAENYIKAMGRKSPSGSDYEVVRIRREQ